MTQQHGLTRKLLDNANHTRQATKELYSHKIRTTRNRGKTQRMRSESEETRERRVRKKREKRERSATREKKAARGEGAGLDTYIPIGTSPASKAS